ncbi:MAG TPA: hypothetical protein VIG51_11275 [Candidatus Baltobacteraceae bacterium]|jgi:outer membrane lipoprotein-sorting protein
MIRRIAVALFAGLLSFGAAPSGAQAAPPEAHAVIQKMLASNPSLRSFQARVHVDVRMLNFPFLSPKLDGTSYFKRPNNYEVVFDRVPSYAKGFQKLFAAIGDPASWEKDQNLAVDGRQSLNGRPAITLRMTKKVHSDQLDYTVAYVDPSTYQVLQMEWHYTNGGLITMTQTFKGEGPYTVIASQHAEIHIPHVRAVADASYAQYRTNVAVDDAVFARK